MGRRWTRSRLGLRARATVAFGVTALIVAMVLAALTYTLARSYLLEQRNDTAERQTYVNARLLRAALRADDPDVPGILAGVTSGTASGSVLRYRGDWYSTSVAFGPDGLPEDVVRVVTDGHAGRQRYRDGDGELGLVVGVPIAASDASYFELFALDEMDHTLDLLARSLALGVVGAAIAAAAIGRASAARLLQPLAPIADAAERIADGALDTRLTDVHDPDLRRLTDAFNTMAEALEARIDREARFAADVSHELRSPLTAVAAALEIMDRRREQLPPEVIEAFNVLTSKVASFQRMVLDLLEISRVDAGTAALAEDLIDLEHFVPRLLAHHSAEGATVTFAEGAPTRIAADRRRLAQALANVIDNAQRYAGGTTAVTVRSGGAESVEIVLDDRGPGVSPDERDAIFGRFARGEAGDRAGSASGTGLGLALTAEHVRLHGGRAWVEENPAGGARFVIRLPVGAL